MPLPPIAPFPPANLRREIIPEEWEACLDAWIALAEAHLRSGDQVFRASATGDSPLVTFLLTYFHEASAAASKDVYFQGPKASNLRRSCFLLSHRLLSGNPIPSASLTSWTFLADLCRAFPRSESLRDVLRSLWARKREKVEAELQKLKVSLTQSLESDHPDVAEQDIKRLAPLMHASPDVAVFFIVGSDFLDSLSAGYIRASAALRARLVTIAYLGLVSLARAAKPNYSLLSDHLYGLKSNAEAIQRADSSSGSLLADLVTNTPILQKIRDSSSNSEGARAKNLAASLSALRLPAAARPKRLIRRKVDKGKARASDEYGHGAFEGGVHVHRMSLISQVQDLFPDLGSGFVVKLLDAYGDDVEQVTAHLLDGSLPAYLAEADRTEQLPQPAETPPELAPHLAPRSTPPPQRRNVFDNDELDRLAVDASRLHIGRKNEKLTADTILSDRSAAPQKAAILSALAAFDLDDDERDDTYDAEDVGGTVEPGYDEVDIDVREKNEEVLFKAYTTSSDLFNRDAATRRSSARAALKNETGMTDEAIEGWAIMTGRDPRKLRRLEAKFTAFSGQQNMLAPTAYRSSPAGSGAEESDMDGESGRGRGGRGGARGRGQGRGGRGGRGGNVAGPVDEKGTQVARQRKEASKGSRANHNRRDQRARKMARGGFPG
ncbi:hypothetical protein W97_04399 [Coniosporium apollinis CBS 100218]|uniref:CUE domain-containing protein n=1 Tax=Coniosporium apollinis (strain CBS 100218) TaxID=1168221 RepID=R7YTB5_CONA1|nr:uncharacterized protein W97_04399 [Coniosporium apollinis CBS 100218]EON65162.1 hypothetical protein W97_04399 [Coniosporium apollinis CBS 100218]